MLNHKKYMRIAIDEARQRIGGSGPPFGCIVISSKGEVISKANDTVYKDNNITSHSEINAIKAACQKVGLNLSDCTVYSTCEPCPMCFGAIWLSKVKTIVFGSFMSDAIKYSGGKVRQLNIPVEHLNLQSGSQIMIIKKILREECNQLWTLKIV